MFRSPGGLLLGQTIRSTWITKRMHGTRSREGQKVTRSTKIVMDLFGKRCEQVLIFMLWQQEWAYENGNQPLLVLTQISVQLRIDSRKFAMSLYKMYVAVSFEIETNNVVGFSFFGFGCVQNESACFIKWWYSASEWFVCGRLVMILFVEVGTERYVQLSL
jgi:hypothetical protein